MSRLSVSRIFILPFLLTGIGGCSLIPNYERPDAAVADKWPAAAGPTKPSASAADIGWRDFFKDPVLQELITLSLENNRDLRTAILNVAQAQAQYRVDRSSLFPTLDAQGGIDASQTPGDTVGQTSAYNTRQYSLGLGTANWELDLFGRIRSVTEQQGEIYLSDAGTRISTEIALIAQVASSYLTWLADREALKVSQDTAKTERDSLKLTQLRVSQGSATELDAAQAETTLRTAEASVAQYQRQVAQDLNQIVLLAGAPLPKPLLARMDASARASTRFPALPAGLPSDVLLRRPDVLAAEHQLKGANANIGAARAAFFPELTLTASGGTASNGLKHLFGPGQAAWAVDPQVSMPIFDAGRNEANLDIAEIQKQTMIANYQKAIQMAFHDVADALAARGTYVRQVSAEEALVQSSTHYYNLADMRFKGGADNYLNVLLAQSTLFSAQLNLISLRLAAMQNTITLYKSLGGGWKEHTGDTRRTLIADRMLKPLDRSLLSGTPYQTFEPPRLPDLQAVMSR